MYASESYQMYYNWLTTRYLAIYLGATYLIYTTLWVYTVSLSAMSLDAIIKHITDTVFFNNCERTIITLWLVFNWLLTNLWISLNLCVDFLSMYLRYLKTGDGMERRWTQGLAKNCYHSNFFVQWLRSLGSSL